MIFYLHLFVDYIILRNNIFIMQKIAILLLAILFFSEVKINGQETLKELTNYKTDSKSFQFVASFNEYLLVDNGEYYLDVLSINDEGQLYKVFESELPYCINGQTIRADINDTHILCNYGDHLVLQNFHTGVIRRVDNLPPSENEIYPTAYFRGSDYYCTKADSNYLYFLDNDSLQGIYKNGPDVKGDFIEVYKEVNNETRIEIEYVPENKIFKFEKYDQIFYDNKFPGFMYQHQPFTENSFFSEKYVLYIVDEFGKLDSINRPLPKLCFIDKAKYSSSLLMLSEDRYESSLGRYNVFYKYDISIDTLIPLDTLRGFELQNIYLITDSLYSFKDFQNFYIGNLYTKEKLKIDLPEYTYVVDHVQSKLIFLDHHYPILVYDYYDRTLNKLTENIVLSSGNIKSLKKVDKAYYFNLDKLNFPLYEVSDSIYSHDQTIATSANQNGLHTTYIQKSDNYIYTFEEDGIVVLDTTQNDGYRYKKLINHPIISGYFKYGWYSYKDIFYCQIPVKRDGKIFNELVSLNLKNLELTNLTEDLDLPAKEGNIPFFLNGFKGFLFFSGNLIDIEGQTVIDPETSLITSYFTGIMKLDNKVIYMTTGEIIEYTYPELNYIRRIEVKSTRQIGDKYFAYNTYERPDIFILSDGSNEVEITDLMDFNIGYYLDYINPRTVIIASNYITNQIRIYVISNHTDGTFKVEQVYDKTFDDITNLIEAHFDEYICFSVVTPSGVVSHFYNQITNKNTELKGLFVHKIIDFYDNHVIYLNDSIRKIEKINLEGQVVESLDYLDNTERIYPDYLSNSGHNGLYILDYSSINKNLKIVFDSETFSYLYNTECGFDFFLRNGHDNVIYKDNAYYFNLDIGEKGRQIYKLYNPYDTGTSPTIDGKISTFGLYPNPVTSALDIKTSEPCTIHSLKVYDYLGRSHPVLHQPCETTIQVDHLEQGAYIIELIEGASRKVARFVKM